MIRDLKVTRALFTPQDSSQSLAFDAFLHLAPNGQHRHLTRIASKGREHETHQII